ncbi:hypothetical protein [Agathobaculum sp. TL06]
MTDKRKPVRITARAALPGCALPAAGCFARKRAAARGQGREI